MITPGGNSGSDPKEQLLTAYSVMFYFTGSIITIEPDSEGLPGFCASGLLKNLPVSSLNPGFAAAYGFFNAPCDHKGSCNKNVAENFHRLFAVRNSASAWPAESVWCTHTESKKGRDEDSNGDFYKKYSFSPDNDHDLPSDHLGIQLLFYNKLISAFLNASDARLRESLRSDIVSFSDKHLLNWLPAWVKAVTDNSRTKCFKGIAYLILASVEDVKSLMVNVSKN